MEKKNCWEMKKCGREPGGSMASVKGVCPAAMDYISNGINGGLNGGRVCWVIAGTFSGQKVPEECARKQGSCMHCEVFRQVKSDAELSGFIRPATTYETAA